MTWQPETSLATLQAKAKLLHTIREFFANKNILEVQTPLIQKHSVTDPFIESIATPYGYLQTSPEYAMKKLLALHKRSIYQICKAFRDEQNGRWHANEFTMLEWYVVDAGMHDLIAQVCELILLLFPSIVIEKKSYRYLFMDSVKLDPFNCTAEQAYTLLSTTEKLPIGIDANLALDDYLQIIMSELIEPMMPENQAMIVFDYPVGQSALAQLTEQDYGLVAERFELYINGIECGNGFHELQDAVEQRQRFEKNQQQRQQLQLQTMHIDEDFLQALQYGLPKCSGIAIGLDRLLMLKEGVNHIHAVTR